MKSQKIHPIAPFLQTKKKINPEIFSVTAWLQHTHDCKMQRIQKTYVASTALIINAASELTKLLPNHNNVNLDMKTPLSLPKNSFSLAGNVNQALNQYWHDIFIPILPS